jgi:hypothetical protein
MRRASHIRQLTQGALLASCLSGIALAQTAPSLEEGFKNPPASAEPRVWWHWMNGNITKEGIQLDLEWMHRSHIAGFQNFDAALFTPQLVEKRLAYMTPEWKDAFRYATSLAKDLGMEEAIAGSPGWSETGGPWVPGSQAMKKYVWSETVIEGGKPFTGKLAHPPVNTGAFQNLPIHDLMASDTKAPEFYADSAVIAYRMSPTQVKAALLKPKITSSGGAIDASLLSDGVERRGTEGRQGRRQGLDTVRVSSAPDYSCTYPCSGEWAEPVNRFSRNPCRWRRRARGK